MIYGDKTVLNANTGVADTYLCKADDMNAIKTFAATGWYPITTEATLTYSSYNSTTKTGVVTTSATLAGLISVGMKMKFTQSSTVKYAIVTAISSTTITLFFGQNGGALTNANITLACWSTQRTPYGFPTGWHLEVSSTAFFGVLSVTAGTFYSVDNLNLSLPVGMWNVDFRFLICCNAGLPYCSGGISTNTTSLSLPKTVSRYVNVVCGNFHGKEKITISSATNLYSVFVASSNASVYFPTDAYTENFIRAECAYI